MEACKHLWILVIFASSDIVFNACSIPDVAPSENEMELAVNRPAESPAKGAPRRRHRASKPQLLTRSQLDGRTGAARLFARLVADIEVDLGGAAQLSTIERALVEGFAGAALTLHNLNTRLALGEAIDLGQHAQAVSAMVRVASRLGLSRRTKDIGLSLGDLLRADLEEQRSEATAKATDDREPDAETLTTDGLEAAADEVAA